MTGYKDNRADHLLDVLLQTSAEIQQLWSEEQQWTAFFRISASEPVAFQSVFRRSLIEATPFPTALP